MCPYYDQPQGDESQDNVGTGAEISTENEALAIFSDGSDGVPPSGATPSAPAVSSHSSEAETKASAAAAEAAKGFMDTLAELPGGAHQSVRGKWEKEENGKRKRETDLSLS